jgi:hypothetical protein
MAGMTTRLLVAALAATASLAACGADDPSSSGNNDAADAKQAMLDYARCMRRHGVDMPDPQFEGNRVKMTGPKNADRAKVRAAEKACASIRDTVKSSEPSDEQREEFKKAALENARCMREHGIEFPDPTFDENGGASIHIGKGSRLNPDSAKFKAAEKACRDTLPDDVDTDSQGG